MQVISNSGYKLSLRAQRSGVKQSQEMGLLLYETLREHYAVASFAMTNMFLQNWDAPGDRRQKAVFRLRSTTRQETEGRNSLYLMRKSCIL